MYENNNNNINSGHQGYYPDMGQQAVPQPETAPEQQEKPRKKHGMGKVIALLVAVVIAGGGAGFAGAYFGSEAIRGSAIVDGGNASDGASEDGGAASGGSHTSKPDSSTENKPTLDELQQGVTVTHVAVGETEFNSDGSFAYTRDLVAAVRDSVVYVEVYTRSYQAAEEPYGAGSGIIISSDGYIITNAHVVDDMDRFVIHVTTTDPIEGTGVVDEYEAVLVGSDTDTDLAVLKIDAQGLKAAVLGDSDELRLGDDVVAIGNPLGLETSVTKGIVSGLNREQYSLSERELSSIQTDASINSGNSGGGLFNMHGEVVGVVNAKLIYNNAEGVGFAITINEAKSVIDDLISKGYVSGRPILGITCLEVSEYVGAIQGMTPGLYITAIDKSLAIADSELVVGDTIVKVEGISVTSVSEVSDILAEKAPGDVVEVTVVRVDSLGRDREISFPVTLSEYSGG